MNWILLKFSKHCIRFFHVSGGSIWRIPFIVAAIIGLHSIVSICIYLQHECDDDYLLANLELHNWTIYVGKLLCKAQNWATERLGADCWDCGEDTAKKHLLQFMKLWLWCNVTPAVTCISVTCYCYLMMISWIYRFRLMKVMDVGLCCVSSATALAAANRDLS